MNGLKQSFAATAMVGLSVLSVAAQGENTFDPEDVVTATHRIGDYSGSHSERWEQKITGGPETIRPQSSDFGEVDTVTVNQYRLGQSYTLSMAHIDTDPDYTGTPRPDFDYQSTVDFDRASILIDDNDPPLLGYSNGSETNESAGKTVRFGFPKPVLTFPDYTEEAVEDDPGVLILVNDNDSNEDDEIDKDAPFANDPDYVEILLKTELEGMALDEGNVRFSANTSDLRVWDPDDWSTPLSLPTTWNLAEEEGAPFRANGKRLFLEALAPSTTHKDVTLSLDYLNNGTTAAEVEATLLEVDLRVPKIKWANDKNEVQADEFVSESILRDEGAFVPLNDDDDNYSGTADMDDMGEGTELVAIEGPGSELAETDLLPLIIKPIDGLANSGAKFLLDIPSGIRIWQEANRSDRVRGKNDPGDGEPTEIDVAEETTLYIEGIQQGEVELKFDLKFSEQTFEDVYNLKVTVFEIQGPTSVPALGTYEYRIEGASGEWKAPHRGTLFEAEDEAENKREVEWQHDFGWNGKTGAVIYAPIAGLEWGREVDIVELKLASNAHDGENEARGKNVLVGDGFIGIDWDGEVPGNNDTALIKSGGGPHAFRGWVQVNSLRGPTRAGIGNRGVDRLKYGFVQKAKWVTKRAIYPGGERLVSVLEGMGWHLDRFYAEDELWIEDETYELGNGLDNRRSLFQQDENTELTNGELVFHYEFRRGSTLANSGSRLGIMISDQYLTNNEKPTHFQVEGFFDLYIAVTTVSGDEKADERYYKLANQIDPWRYAAFGRITGDEIFPPDSSISGGRNPEDLWGGYSAYAIFAISVKDGGLNNGLRPIADFDEEPFIAQEYPYLMGGQDQHEQWNNQ